MRVLLLAILCLLSYTKAKHFLIETNDSDVNLKAASNELLPGEGEEDMQEAVEEAVEEAAEKAAEEDMEKTAEEAAERAAEAAVEKAAVKAVKEAMEEGQDGEDYKLKSLNKRRRRHK